MKITTEGYVVCELCKAPSNNKDEQDEHFRYHTGHRHKPNGRFSCDRCSKVFQDYSQLNAHLWLYFGVHFCEDCEEKYSDAASLKTHKFEKHSNSKISVATVTNGNGVAALKCGKCQKLFAKKNHLADHMKFCAIRRKYRCKTCATVYDDLNVLNEHLLSHKRVSCNICGESFPSAQELAEHFDTHNVRSNTYDCQKCKKEFDNSLSLEKHLNIHKKGFECNICHMPFWKKLFVVRHKRLHHKNNWKALILDQIINARITTNIWKITTMYIYCPGRKCKN
jgi:hypothetical protein